MENTFEYFYDDYVKFICHVNVLYSFLSTPLIHTHINVNTFCIYCTVYVYCIHKGAMQYTGKYRPIFICMSVCINATWCSFL